MRYYLLKTKSGERVGAIVDNLRTKEVDTQLNLIPKVYTNARGKTKVHFTLDGRPFCINYSDNKAELWDETFEPVTCKFCLNKLERLNDNN